MKTKSVIPAVEFFDTKPMQEYLPEILQHLGLLFNELESQKAVIRDKKGNELDLTKVSKLFVDLNKLLQPYLKGEQLCQNKRNLN